MTTALDIPQLSEREARKLVAQINTNIEDVASQLTRLYYGKGWAALGYRSWKECCAEEFDRSASWACRQIKASEARAALPQGNDIPERHLRELRKLPEDQRADAWQDITERLGDSPTAEQVKHEVYMMLPDDDPPESPETPQDATEDEEASEDEGGEGDALLGALCNFHDEEWPEMSWSVFAARVENAAEKIRGLT